MNMDQLEERFGQVPPGIRSYVGAILATSAGGCSAVTLDGTFVRYHGDCQMTCVSPRTHAGPGLIGTCSVFLHESGHAFDSGFSGTQGWNDAIAASSCVPDGYANSNPVEVRELPSTRLGGLTYPDRTGRKSTCCTHTRSNSALYPRIPPACSRSSTSSRTMRASTRVRTPRHASPTSARSQCTHIELHIGNLH